MGCNRKDNPFVSPQKTVDVLSYRLYVAGITPCWEANMNKKSVVILPLATALGALSGSALVATDANSMALSF